MTSDVPTRETSPPLTSRAAAEPGGGRPQPPRFAAALTIVLLLTATSAGAQYQQQGDKLVGAGAVGAARQGSAVALSADGNTLAVGGRKDNDGAGATWVFTRSGGVWRQQGDKLVGTGAVGSAQQGTSIAISGDGRTILVGGADDDGRAGAAWVFTRSGDVWRQQGDKLVGSGAVGAAWQGRSVALSADGSTAIVGGSADNVGTGAAWVFTRSGGVWRQQGDKLVGTRTAFFSRQGYAVAVSADGNTAVVGGYEDDNYTGATWVFTRTDSVWRQEGEKLVGTGVVGMASQGISIALSADGNTAAVGGLGDNHIAGATWVFVRHDGAWRQQGDKLVGSGAAGQANQGKSVAVSGDGNIVIVGGGGDDAQAGAAWAFARSDGTWSQLGPKLVGSGVAGLGRQGVSISLSADGSTTAVGGYGDSDFTGATWVFVASDSTR